MNFFFFWIYFFFLLKIFINIFYFFYTTNKLMYFSVIEKFDIVNFFDFHFFFLDFSFSTFFLYLLFVQFYLILFSIGLFNVVPTFYQMITSFFVRLVLLTINSYIGKKGFIFFSLIFNIFVFVFILNLYGTFPFNFSLTVQPAFTFFFSLIVFMSSVFLGLYINGYKMYKLFVPNVPNYMLPLLFIIEFVSYLLRLFSLAIRLSANITSGHVLLLTIASFSVLFFEFNFFFFFLSSSLLLFLLILEVFIAFLQAYVFIVLTCLYFSDSLNLLTNHN